MVIIKITKKLLEDDEGGNVTDETDHHGDDHEDVPCAHGEAHHEQLGEYERRERDRHNVVKVLLEEDERAVYDCRALVHAYQAPQQKCLVRQRTAFGQLLVQLRVRQCDQGRHVLVKHKREHGEHCVNSGVPCNIINSLILIY